MNTLWKNFLLAEQAVFKNDESIVFPGVQSGNEKRIYPIAHLGVLSITGKDAGTLLQGQITCNVHEVTEHKAKLAAMCNAKGRVVTTFLLLKNKEGFLLVLPKALLDSVKKRLQMYVLRSVVTLTDSSDTLCLIGLTTPDVTQTQQFDSQGQALICVQMSALENRQLLVADTDQAMAVWSHYVADQGFHPDNSDVWRYLDMMSGIPWLDLETSEEYIPQMLNIDKLGGISFNKGCYTGQEIVARTHYLGKAKRALFIAQSDSSLVPAANAPVFDDSTDNTQAVGSVLSALQGQDNCTMLVVLNISETTPSRLTLADQTPLALLV
ncbi:Folate-binding protein YgfZ [Crenothrix polyspora]|uniref:Folate-binding protein YgfZ n=1 Tax=Crenothrix polyspora TaxID=360316 RepID=A0A1R4HDU3_9GAMM|nr:folate-binding protein YgfZ [Crenothrix polyspora]SJM94418.1 Folate-binding protein YgfZ [Crenothrix polyspora]